MITIESKSGECISVNSDELSYLDLSYLNLHGAILTNQVMSGTKFLNSDLRGALFDSAKINNCDFRYAKMMNAFLMGADLNNSNLRFSSLVGAVLDGTDLRGADLTGTDIAYASFKGANACGAIFLCERILEADLSDIIFNDETIFPDGFVLNNGRFQVR